MNQEDFSQSLERVFDPAFRLAMTMLNERTAAEDAAQEAALKAWRAWPRFRAGADFRPWFLSIVANECRMSRRARWFSVIKLADVRHQTAAPDEGHEDLRAAVRRLSADDRLPLVLHFYLDLPLDEVARTLGVSTSAAKSRIYRAAKRLRTDLTMEEVF